MSDQTFALRLAQFDVAVRIGFDTPQAAALIRSCVEGRVSGARLPAVSWEPDGTQPADIELHVEEDGDDLIVRFSGAVQTPAYRVDKPGFHWDFGKALTSAVLPQILAQGVMTLHAATLAWGERCVLLPGSSGSGKSSVTYSSMARGVQVRASELSFVRDGNLVAGNSRLTIDEAALLRFGVTRPAAAHELDRRLVVDLPADDRPTPITRLAFPRVSLGDLTIRTITPRRARMLLYENAISQLPMSHLLAHETHPIATIPTADQLAEIARQIHILSELDPVIVEGRPQQIAQYLAEEA